MTQYMSFTQSGLLGQGGISSTYKQRDAERRHPIREISAVQPGRQHSGDDALTGASHLLHELLYEGWVVPAIQHCNVKELWHVQEPIIVQHACLVLC